MYRDENDNPRLLCQHAERRTDTLRCAAKRKAARREFLLASAELFPDVFPDVFPDITPDIFPIRLAESLSSRLKSISNRPRELSPDQTRDQAWRSMRDG